MARYHVNPESGRPNLCNAKTPDACLYYDAETNTEAPHFDNKADARKHVEKEMNKEYGTTTTVATLSKAKGTSSTETLKNSESTKLIETENIKKLKNLINENNDEKYAKEPELYISKMQEMGEIFNNELEERLGFDPNDLDLTTYNPNLTKVGIATRKLLSELKKTGTVENVEITGKYGKRLKEAISILPNNTHFKQSIYVAVENKDVKTRGGSFINGKKLNLTKIGRRGTNNLPKDLKAGDFLIGEGIYISNLDESGSGATVERITEVRNCNNPKDYDAFKRSVDPNEKETLEAIKYIENSGWNKYGYLLRAPEEIDKKFPNFSKTFYNTKIYETEQYYLSDLGAPKQKGRSFLKVNNGKPVNVTVKNGNGDSVQVSKPIYKEKVNTIDRSKSTIRFKQRTDPDIENSTLIHEYCHSLQTFRKNPTEREFFKQLTKDNIPINDSLYHEERYDGFPSSYMGVARGNELLTVATESWLYPENNLGLYGKDQKETAKPIRNWIAGFWLTR